MQENKEKSQETQSKEEETVLTPEQEEGAYDFLDFFKI